MSGPNHNQADQRVVHRHSEKAHNCTHLAEHCCVECCEPGGVRGEVSS